MLLLGDAIQIFHILLTVGVVYLMSRGFGTIWGTLLSYVWFVSVMLSNLIFGGCILTQLSNTALASGGGETYGGLLAWASQFIGDSMLVDVTLSVFFLSTFALGLYMRKRSKAKAA